METQKFMKPRPNEGKKKKNEFEYFTSINDINVAASSREENLNKDKEFPAWKAFKFPPEAEQAEGFFFT